MKPKMRLQLMLIVGLSVMAAGCGSQPAEERASVQDSVPVQESAPVQETSPQAPAELKRYDLKGRIVSIDKSAQALTIDHERIVGFMGAMTMDFPVKDARVLETLTSGDEITATVVASTGDYWVEDVVVTNPGAAPK